MDPAVETAQPLPTELPSVSGDLGSAPGADRLERQLHATSELLIAAGEDLNFAELMDRVVGIIRDCTGADGAFLHLWDDDRERLVLSAATEGTAKAFLHQVELRLGQGLSGLAALRRRPVVVNTDPTEDPHFEHFPELGEERYRSTAKFPILRNDSTLIGVLSLNSQDPDSFHEGQLALAKDLTRLVAGIVARASLGGNIERRSDALRQLSGLAASLCSTRPEYEILGAATATTAKLLGADLVILSLADPETGEPAVKALAPYRSDVLDSLASFSRDRAASSATGEASSITLARYLETELVTKIGAVSSVPLVVGDARLGTLRCYRPARLSADDHDLLSLISRQIALALSDASDRWAGPDMSAKAFFERLAEQDLDEHAVSMATAIGANISKPHVMVSARIDHAAAPSYDIATRDLTLIEGTIRSLFPGSVTYSSFDHLVGMVEVNGPGGDRRLAKRLLDVVADSQRRNGSAPTVGLSGVVTRPIDLHQALMEANDALHIGTLLGASPVVHHDDIAARVHIYRMVLDPSFGRDPTVALVRMIERYDTDHQTDLLQTLDVYMTCHANGSSAAGALGIHRNTLRQRIDRISQISGLALDDPSEWLAIQLAVCGVLLRSDPGTQV